MKRPRKTKVPAVTLMNLKVASKDRSGLVAQAKRYAKGNLSAWLRFAGQEFRPTKSQLAKLVA